MISHLQVELTVIDSEQIMYDYIKKGNYGITVDYYILKDGHDQFKISELEMTTIPGIELMP